MGPIWRKCSTIFPTKNKKMIFRGITVLSFFVVEFIPRIDLWVRKDGYLWLKTRLSHKISQKSFHICGLSISIGFGFHWMKPETPETPIFHGKIHGFQWRCSHQNQSIDIRPAQLLHRALIAKAPARRWGVYMHMIRVYDTYPLASMQKTGKSQCLSTLSMAIFNSKLLVYQRVVNLG